MGSQLILTHDELRYILDPKEVHGEDFSGEPVHVVEEQGNPLVWGVQDETSSAGGVGWARSKMKAE